MFLLRWKISANKETGNVENTLAVKKLTTDEKLYAWIPNIIPYTTAGIRIRDKINDIEGSCPNVIGINIKLVRIIARYEIIDIIENLTTPSLFPLIIKSPSNKPQNWQQSKIPLVKELCYLVSVQKAKKLVLNQIGYIPIKKGF